MIENQSHYTDMQNQCEDPKIERSRKFFLFDFLKIKKFPQGASHFEFSVTSLMEFLVTFQSFPL